MYHFERCSNPTNAIVIELIKDTWLSEEAISDWFHKMRAFVSTTKSLCSVYVFKAKEKTFGEAKDKVKRLGEKITEGTKLPFLFMLDDNISHWYGVTLIDDPCLMCKCDKKAALLLLVT